MEGVEEEVMVQLTFAALVVPIAVKKETMSKKGKRINDTFTDFFKNVQLLFHNDLTRTIVFSLV